MDDKLKKLEQQYKDVPIPKELEQMIEQNLQRKPKKKRKMPVFLGTAAAAALLFTAGLNTSPAMAKNLADVPVLGSVVQVLTFVEYEIEEETFTADIEVPQITGSSEEIQALNAKYEEEGKALYEQFKAEMAEMDGGHLGLNSGYIVETDTEQLLSFGRYTEVTMASSSTEMHYTTIDKKAETVITLPSLFKDERYVDIISHEIAEQMRAEMKATNGEKHYWVSGTQWSDETFGSFERIQPDQSFFITEAGKLVISFDKYEVAPGYMGIAKFEIPTALLEDVLVSQQYIR